MLYAGHRVTWSEWGDLAGAATVGRRKAVHHVVRAAIGVSKGRDGVREGGTGICGVLCHGIGWRKRGRRGRVGAIAREGEGSGVVIEQIVGWMVRHIHGFWVIEVLGGDRLGEVMRRRSSVHRLQRREGMFEVRGIETVCRLVRSCRARIHVGVGRGRWGRWKRWWWWW